MGHTEQFAIWQGPKKLTVTVNHYDKAPPDLSLLIKDMDNNDEQHITFGQTNALKTYRFIGSAIFRTGERQ